MTLNAVVYVRSINGYFVLNVRIRVGNNDEGGSPIEDSYCTLAGCID